MALNVLFRWALEHGLKKASHASRLRYNSAAVGFVVGFTLLSFRWKVVEEEVVEVVVVVSLAMRLLLLVALVVLAF